MNEKGWALFNYAFAILFLLVLLFMRDPDYALVGALLLVATLASQLLLLHRELDWDVSHFLGLGFLLLTSLFTIIFLIWEQTTLSIIFASLLLLFAAILIIGESIEELDSWSPFDYFLRGKLQHQAVHEDDWVVEAIQPREVGEQFYTTGGSTIYHTDGCRSLQRKKKDDVIELSSREETLAYGLTPCKVCKP